ncbi:hypothetical protein MPER_07988 [Moniliophthora perniciosa FA553]|nr:hypothetical protein MPER_07988 [Moniliophthora perniciosa FA553]
MTSEERKAHLKKVATRESTPEQRLAKAVKGFLFWRQGNLKKKEGELELSKLFQDLRDQPPPRKRQLTHFLMTHPDYKGIIKDTSTESCTRDRLKCRKEAAKTLIKELEAEGKLDGIVQDRDQEHADAMEVWKSREQEQVDSYRASIGNVVQPILNRLQEETGLHFVLLGGEDVDGKGTFNAMA